MCDSCKLVCVVMSSYHATFHQTGNTRKEPVFDPAFEHTAMSNNDLVQMNHIAVTLFRFWVQDPAIWLLQDIRDSFNKSLTAVVRQTTTSAALYCRIYSRHPTHPRLDKRSCRCSPSTCSRRDPNVCLPTTFRRGRAVFFD